MSTEAPMFRNPAAQAYLLRLVAQDLVHYSIARRHETIDGAIAEVARFVMSLEFTKRNMEANLIGFDPAGPRERAIEILWDLIGRAGSGMHGGNGVSAAIEAIEGGLQCAAERRDDLLQVAAEIENLPHPGLATPPPAADESVDVTDREETVMEVLREAGRRLKGEALLVKAFGDKGYSGSNREMLSNLMKRGILDNNKDGYGIPYHPAFTK